MADTPTTAREQVAQPWYKLGTLPSTNWKMVTGTIVLMATMVQYFLLQWMTTEVKQASGVTVTVSRDNMVSGAMWDSWLLFVATAVLLVPAGQYVAKRMTFKPGGPDDRAAALGNAASAADVARETGAEIPVAEPVPTAPQPPAPRTPVVVPDAYGRSPASTAAGDAPGQQVLGEGD